MRKALPFILAGCIVSLDIAAPLDGLWIGFYLLPLFLLLTGGVSPLLACGLISLLLFAAHFLHPAESTNQQWLRVAAALFDWVFAGFLVAYIRQKQRTVELEAGERIRKTREYADLLDEVNRRIHSTLNSAEIFEWAATDGAKAMGTEGGSVGVFDQDRVVVKHAYNVPDSASCRLPECVNPKDDVIAWNDVMKDPRLKQEDVKKLGVRSAMCAPLKTADTVFGVLGFYNCSSRINFTEEQIEFARKLGESVSLALENAAVFERHCKSEEELRGRKEELEESKRQLETTLAEKEELFRELHHRTKNNMAVISSLINLQGINALREIQNKIRAMSMVHEKLSRGNLSGIDLKAYLTELSQATLQGFGGRTPVKLKVDIESVPLSVDFAVPCGLIMTELMMNSLKYAFPERKGVSDRSAKIEIWGRCRNEHLDMVFCDNGVGLPGDLNLQGGGSLGLKLVFDLVKQLGGAIEVTCDKGVQFQMRFPLDRARFKG